MSGTTIQISWKIGLYFGTEKLYLSMSSIVFKKNAENMRFFGRFLEVETCRSLVRSETENCVYVSEWRRKNGKIDPTHSCPMNIQVDLPKESAFVTDSSLLLAEKILSKLVRLPY